MAMTASAVTARPLMTGGSALVRWNNPPANDFPPVAPFSGVRVVRRERDYPQTEVDGDTVYDGEIVSEILDAALAPLTTYYYTVFTYDTGLTFRSGSESQAAVFATADYGIAGQLYNLLPAVHLRDDAPLTAPEVAALPSLVRERLRNLPGEQRNRGQLARFLSATLRSFELVRSFAEGLPQFRNIDQIRMDFLPPVATSLGWELDETLPISRQRNEIRFAPRLYRRTGTAPSLWELVNRYTRWGAQFVEYAQHVAKTHEPPTFNQFALLESGGVWRSRDDAALALGFGPGNNIANGAASTAAVLTGSVAEPFSLIPEHRLSFSVDGRPPMTITFREPDFVDISAATVAEVARVVNGLSAEVSAVARPDGRLELVSHTLGPDSQIRIEVRAAELVSIEAAPRGRLNFVPDATGPTRHWIFYAVADPATAATEIAAQEALRGHWPDSRFSLANTARAGAPHQIDPAAVARSRVRHTLSLPRREVRYRTLRDGVFGCSHPVTADLPPAGEPCTTQLNDGRIVCAWVSPPGASEAEVYYRVGQPQTPEPARLAGSRSAPFALRSGDRLTLQGSWPEARGIEFTASDFVDIAAATEIEVAAAINARLPGVIATAQPDHTLAIETAEIGGNAKLAIDATTLRTARALGFSDGRASGSWGDAIDFGPPELLPTLAPGRYSDLHAITDGAGTVRVFYAVHQGGRWQIASVNWDGVVWSAPETLTAAGSGHREPFAVLDATARIWLTWSQRVGFGTLEDEWSLRQRMFDPGPSVWGPEAALVPPVAGTADREPGALLTPGGDIRWLFRSNRGGGPDIWEVILDPTTNTVSVPVQVTNTAEAAIWPALAELPGGDVLLLHRADRSLSRSSLGARRAPAADVRVIPVPQPPPTVFDPPASSYRSVDAGTLTRQTGSQTVAFADSARLGLRDTRVDLLSYTPAKPAGSPLEAPLDNSDLYTRGTVGLFLHRLISGTMLGSSEQERLFAVLRRFLPINVRVVIRVEPPVFVELVYSPARDIQESYLDVYPFIERYEGLEDSYAAELPDWEIFLTNTVDHVTVDFGDLTTARRRTFYPPPD